MIETIEVKKSMPDKYRATMSDKAILNKINRDEAEDRYALMLINDAKHQITRRYNDDILRPVVIQLARDYLAADLAKEQSMRTVSNDEELL